jgi:hypothetical protein
VAPTAPDLGGGATGAGCALDAQLSSAGFMMTTFMNNAG